MYNYKDVVSYKVYNESQGWIKKKWEQNLKKYGMKGTVRFDEESNLHLIITSKINLKKIRKASKRFQKKLHKAGKTKKGTITYILKDGREISPDDVLFPEEFHKLEEFLKREQ